MLVQSRGFTNRYNAMQSAQQSNTQTNRTVAQTIRHIRSGCRSTLLPSLLGQPMQLVALRLLLQLMTLQPRCMAICPSTSTSSSTIAYWWTATALSLAVQVAAAVAVVWRLQAAASRPS